MTHHRKIITFLILLQIVSISLIVYRYENLLEQSELNSFRNNSLSTTSGAISDSLSEKKLIEIIKATDVYIGDSIYIDSGGQIKSGNDKFQGTMNAVLSSDDNMNIVRDNMSKNNMPLQYNIYHLAAEYYRQQYPSEFINPK